MGIFGVRVRQERLLKEINVPELARQAGLYQGTIYNLELGCQKWPSTDTAIRLANALDVSIDYLVGRTERKELPDDCP
jgi:transcriptional regulator with XRE-family HTH domain